MPPSTTNSKPYRAFITREPFLFHEMRTTAKLLSEGFGDEQVLETIINKNLFQYPTEKSVRRMVRACIRRLRNMQDDSLIVAISQQPQAVAKQICLYALMKEHRLVLDFMLTVIGEKFRLQDTSLSRADINIFFLRLQEQDDGVASWSDSTIAKIKQILARILVETGYLDTLHSVQLRSVMLPPVLENAIRTQSDGLMLPAFNSFH